jgi:hypothetical protein
MPHTNHLNKKIIQNEEYRMSYNIHTNKATKPKQNIEFMQSNDYETLETYSFKYTSKQQKKLKQWHGFTL